MLGGAGGRTRRQRSILAPAARSRSRCSAATRSRRSWARARWAWSTSARIPKIGRVVAIKTMALSQEFEADELASVKERFFREAETAGRLTHPNIVTIYDAGEEHDLCYIAMELLKGGDLVPYMQGRQPAAAGQGGVHRRARRGRARLRAHAERGASRHQAREHHVRPGHRHGQGHRLRHRAPHRLVQDQDRHGARHAVVHVAGAAGRQEDRGALRPVLARGEPLPAAVRASCRSRASRWRS